MIYDDVPLRNVQRSIKHESEKSRVLVDPPTGYLFVYILSLSIL